MKGGSVGPAARVGCRRGSLGALVLVLVLVLLTPELDFDTSRTLFSAGLCLVFKVGAWVCSSAEGGGSGWKVETGGGRVHCSLLILLSRGSSESLWRTEEDLGHCRTWITWNTPSWDNSELSGSTFSKYLLLISCSLRSPWSWSSPWVTLYYQPDTPAAADVTQL